MFFHCQFGLSLSDNHRDIKCATSAPERLKWRMQWIMEEYFAFLVEWETKLTSPHTLSTKLTSYPKKIRGTQGPYKMHIVWKRNALLQSTHTPTFIAVFSTQKISFFFLTNSEDILLSIVASNSKEEKKLTQKKRRRRRRKKHRKVLNLCNISIILLVWHVPFFCLTCSFAQLHS